MIKIAFIVRGDDGSNEPKQQSVETRIVDSRELRNGALGMAEDIAHREDRGGRLVLVVNDEENVSVGYTHDETKVSMRLTIGCEFSYYQIDYENLVRFLEYYFNPYTEFNGLEVFAGQVLQDLSDEQGLELANKLASVYEAKPFLGEYFPKEAGEWLEAIRLQHNEYMKPVDYYDYD